MPSVASSTPDLENTKWKHVGGPPHTRQDGSSKKHGQNQTDTDVKKMGLSHTACGSLGDSRTVSSMAERALAL